MPNGEELACLPWHPARIDFDTNRSAGRQHHYEVLGVEPFVREDDMYISSSVDRLYRSSKRRLVDEGQHAVGASSATNGPCSMFELIMDGAPAVFSALSAVGLLSALSAFDRQGYEFLVPSILAAIGFAVLGGVSSRIRSLIRDRRS
jgi:hypothetical protein